MPIIVIGLVILAIVLLVCGFKTTGGGATVKRAGFLTVVIAGFALFFFGLAGLYGIVLPEPDGIKVRALQSDIETIERALGAFDPALYQTECKAKGLKPDSPEEVETLLKGSREILASKQQELVEVRRVTKLSENDSVSIYIFLGIGTVFLLLLPLTKTTVQQDYLIAGAIAGYAAYKLHQHQQQNQNRRPPYGG